MMERFSTGDSKILKCIHRLSCLHSAHLIWISDVAVRWDSSPLG